MKKTLMTLTLLSSCLLIQSALASSCTNKMNTVLNYFQNASKQGTPALPPLATLQNNFGQTTAKPIPMQLYTWADKQFSVITLNDNIIKTRGTKPAALNRSGSSPSTGSQLIKLLGEPTSSNTTMVLHYQWQCADAPQNQLSVYAYNKQLMQLSVTACDQQGCHSWKSSSMPSPTTDPSTPPSATQSIDILHSLIHPIDNTNPAYLKALAQCTPGSFPMTKGSASLKVTYKIIGVQNNHCIVQKSSKLTLPQGSNLQQTQIPTLQCTYSAQNIRQLLTQNPQTNDSNQASTNPDQAACQPLP